MEMAEFESKSESESESDFQPDEYYQQQFIRSLYSNTNHENDDTGDDNDEEIISKHTWICPDDTSISIFYHLTMYAPGHGNRMWNSSACIAQFLLIPDHRSRLFGKKNIHGWYNPSKYKWPPTKCLEFGAGAALPSLALLHQGAHRIVLTDSACANKSTFDALHKSIHVNAKLWNISQQKISQCVQIVPHTWGKDIAELAGTIEGSCQDSFSLADLVIASDCIYNPTQHVSLLQSVVGTMSSDGLFIVGYSLHGNVPSHLVMNFFLVAKHEFGLEVVNECMKEYDGQEGIGSNDCIRGTVYVKVLTRILTSKNEF